MKIQSKFYIKKNTLKINNAFSHRLKLKFGLLCYICEIFFALVR